MREYCEHHSEGVRIPHNPVIHAFLSTYYVPGSAHPFPRIHCTTALAESEGWRQGAVGVSVWVQMAERNHSNLNRGSLTHFLFRKKSAARCQC